MTTANTENEDLQGLVKPKKEEIRPKGPVHHQTLPVDSSGGQQTLPVDSSGGTTQPQGPVHHQTEPVGGNDGGGTTEPDGPVHHQTEPVKP
ncbi:hypothetical protein [Kibdelosporangium phytohabitans]|uniref:Uncharacterized protein n=1 Tax=Kibdelosporangium phytohabitans TaxID=860235 RepID=A0A0N9I4U7_9PSEU|nr:hypothetical protein [Kibdelosporangium phytohabitans]ALG13795.1 hypothetical protein AOZ06_49220 [Kibdelosporangium phytohabitans]MBE1467283.1 hypothetical protein [Kibdelosporangium phytohabitans]